MLLHLSTHQHEHPKNNNDYDKMTLASGFGGWLRWFERENEKLKIMGEDKKLGNF